MSCRGNEFKISETGWQKNTGIRGIPVTYTWRILAVDIL